MNIKIINIRRSYPLLLTLIISMFIGAESNENRSEPVKLTDKQRAHLVELKVMTTKNLEECRYSGRGATIPHVGICYKGRVGGAKEVKDISVKVGESFVLCPADDHFFAIRDWWIDKQFHEEYLKFKKRYWFYAEDGYKRCAFEFEVVKSGITKIDFISDYYSWPSHLIYLMRYNIIIK